MSTLDYTEFSRQRHRELVELGRRLNDLFSQFGLDLHKNRSLSRFLADASIMADFEENEKSTKPSFENLMGALHLHWIGEAVLSGKIPTKFKNKLEELLDGELDLLKRVRTRAKDTLWEFEVRNVLARANIPSMFEEPDLIIPTSATPIGIACKKIYSEENLSKTVSNAVKQIERRGQEGVVALNTDDLLPADVLVKVPNSDRAISHFRRRCEEFIQRHERIFLKYLEAGRCLFVMVSSGGFVDIPESLPRFNAVRQSLSWRVPGKNAVNGEFILKAFGAE